MSLHPTQTVWMTFLQDTCVPMHFQEQGLKSVQLRRLQWGCSSLPPWRMLSNVFKWARHIFIFQWNNKKVETKFSSQVHVEAYSHFTESCACKCEEKFWPSFYFNTFSSFYLCPLWKLYFFSELISYFFSLIIEMTMTAIVVGIFLLLSPVSPPKVRHKI